MGKIYGKTVGGGGSRLTDIPQTDWAQTDATQLDYIKNKPDAGSALEITNESGVLTIQHPDAMYETITTYDIAVEQGFEGTLEEWADSVIITNMASQGAVMATESAARALASATQAESVATKSSESAAKANAMASAKGKLRANTLKGSKSGASISITDASPIEHEMGVKVRGKNLLNIDAGLNYSAQLTKDEDAYILTRLDGAANDGRALPIHIPANIPITLSADIIEYTGTHASPIRATVRYSDGTYDYFGLKADGQPSSIVTKGVVDRVYLHQIPANEVGTYTKFKNIQIEVGETATAYAPYIEDISTVKVKKYGKNLFKATQSKEHRGITFEPLDDGTYHVYGTNDGTGHSAIEVDSVLPAGKYTGSGCPSGGSQTTYHIKFSNLTTNKSPVDYGDGTEFETTATQRIIVQLMVRSGQTVDLIFKPMIEVGTGDKVYAPYIEPIEYPVSADGTVEGVTPIYPTTTLMTDTQGAVIDCTYNRDINKAFEKLAQALISLGANI